jgi:hypothetical protein
VIAGAILLPLAWLFVIFRLIAKYHQFLYAPRDFPKPEYFLETVSAKMRLTLNDGTLGKPSDFTPFKPFEVDSAGDWRAIAKGLRESPVIIS